MAFQPNPEAIVWRLHLASPVEEVYDLLDTDEGRARFWAESAVERDGLVDFIFINGIRYSGRILERRRPDRWSIEYFGSVATFELARSPDGGVDLTLENRNVPAEDRVEVIAGWLNVLLPLKAAVDFGVDLRTHDPARTWDEGYVDQ